MLQQDASAFNNILKNWKHSPIIIGCWNICCLSGCTPQWTFQYVITYHPRKCINRQWQVNWLISFNDYASRPACWKLIERLFSHGMVQNVRRRKYSSSKVILVEVKFTSFHQYLRYCNKCETIAIGVTRATILVKSHFSSTIFHLIGSFEYVIHSWDGLHCQQARPSQE